MSEVRSGEERPGRIIADARLVSWFVVVLCWITVIRLVLPVVEG